MDKSHSSMLLWLQDFHIESFHSLSEEQSCPLAHSEPVQGKERVSIARVIKHKQVLYRPVKTYFTFVWVLLFWNQNFICLASRPSSWLSWRRWFSSGCGHALKNLGNRQKQSECYRTHMHRQTGEIRLFKPRSPQTPLAREGSNLFIFCKVLRLCPKEWNRFNMKLKRTPTGDRERPKITLIQKKRGNKIQTKTQKTSWNEQRKDKRNHKHTRTDTDKSHAKESERTLEFPYDSSCWIW